MKVCHDLPDDMGEGAYSDIVTNGDIEGGGDPKIALFAVTSFFEWLQY